MGVSPATNNVVSSHPSPICPHRYIRKYLPHPPSCGFGIHVDPVEVLELDDQWQRLSRSIGVRRGQSRTARFCASLDDRAKGQEDPEQFTDTWSGEYAANRAATTRGYQSGRLLCATR